MGKCVWKDDGEGNWDTSCGERYIIIEGTPYENNMKFCTYCGRILIERLYVNDDDVTLCEMRDCGDK